MSKELNFGDGYDEVKYLDNSTNFDLVLTTDGIAFDLRQADEITVKIANDSGYIMSKDIDLSTITNPENGEFLLPVDDSIMSVLTPDDYYIEVWLKVNPVTPVTDDQSVTLTVDNDSLEERQSIFPSTGLIGFTIDENIDSDTGEVIPVITFDQFQDKFNDMMAQMQNVVSNVKKGDKGDKGDTGQGLEIKDKVSSVSNLPSTANEGDGYLVGEELYVRVNNAWKDCGPLQGPKGDQGIQGIQGKTGVGISSTTIQYQISSSSTVVPTGTWLNNIVATTTANSYLWMKATLNYTDGTTKTFYLTSQKGDKGDKGDKGATGSQGPQGPVGAGLVVKGTVNDASQLPTTGNQEGYCYFVGTDLYVWDAGAWKNCGSVSPDLSNYVTVTDLNNGLSTKVTDNKDGTEQLNGVQVQPFNKLSDTIGGRNYALNTATPKTITPSVNSWQSLFVTNFSENLNGEDVVFSFDLSVQGATNTSVVYIQTGKDTNPAYFSPTNSNFQIAGPHYSGWQIPLSNLVQNTPTRFSYKFTMPQWANLTKSDILNLTVSSMGTLGASVTISKVKVEQGSVATDWTPAPEDKVNVSDMRKPASDVAGIEEVNAKQDKIGYTPADDSKVVHTTDTSSWQKQKITNDNGAPFVNLTSSTSDLSATLQGLSLGLHTVYANQAVTNNPLNGISSVKGFVDMQGTSFGEGFLAGTSNNQIIQYSVWVTNTGVTYNLLATDSKVAHLSGANNFDTVPTVNNNPLLLASSLPSDLARTSQQTNFTAGLQSNGTPVATQSDVTTAINGTVKFKTLANGTDLFSLTVNDAQPHYYLCSSTATATTLKNSPVTTAFSLELYPADTPQPIASNGVATWTYTQMVLRPLNSSTAWLSSTYSDGAGNLSGTAWVQVATKSDVTNAVNTAMASLPKTEDSDFKALTTTLNDYSGTLYYKVKNGVLYMFGTFSISRNSDPARNDKVPIFTLPAEIASRLPAMPSSIDIYADGKPVTRKCLVSSLSNGFDYWITENGEIVSLPPYTVYNISSNDNNTQYNLFVGNLNFSLPLN